MAAERRWAWPRPRAGDPVAELVSGTGSVTAVLDGLVLITLETPKRLSPPTNSLAPLRCLILLDGVPETAEGVVGSTEPSTRPDVSVALKVKVGNVDTD